MKTREIDSEDYYDEKGNLTKSVSFIEGYPQSVTVWGYIDGNRVNDTASIEYNDAERPKYRHMVIIGMPAGDTVKPESRDKRYSMKFTYKYSEQGQLIEKWLYGNAGETSSHMEYKYKGNQREAIDYDSEGSLMSQMFEILDKDGNVIERYSKDEDGKIGDKEIRTHEFDKEGNWITEKHLSKVR